MDWSASPSATGHGYGDPRPTPWLQMVTTAHESLMRAEHLLSELLSTLDTLNLDYQTSDGQNARLFHWLPEFEQDIVRRMTAATTPLG